MADTLPPAKDSVAWHFAMGELAAAYLQERINDSEYVEAVTALGLSREEAVDRCMIHDDVRARR
jgi:hypothetical protein